MSDLPYTLSPCHCLTIRQASRQMTQFYDQHLAPTGLRATQYSVIRMLARHQPVTMQDFAARMVMDRTTLTRALKPLQRDGLIQVEPGRDARTRMLSLSEAGADLVERSQPVWEGAQAEFETRYGDGPTRELRGMLRRVVERTA